MTRLVRMYKRTMLKYLVLLSLDLTDLQKVALERMHAIWEHLDQESCHAVLSWVTSLPTSLREKGPYVRDDYDRASGDVICTHCGLAYYDHPEDPRDKTLVVACNGRRWHL